MEAVKRGHTVWGIARNEHRLEALKTALGAHFNYSICDLTDVAAVDLCFRKIDTAGFIADVVFLNAGLYKMAEHDFLDWEFVKQNVSINYSAKIYLLIKLGQLQHQPKEIILISSIFAKINDAKNPFYTGAKAGSSATVNALRLHENYSAVKLKTVYLGPIHTLPDHPKKLYTPTVEQSAKNLLNMIGKNKTSVYYPWFGAPFAFFIRLLPTGLFKYIFDRFRRH